MTHDSLPTSLSQTSTVLTPLCPLCLPSAPSTRPLSSPPLCLFQQAASFGSVFGSHKWPMSNRTLEGSAAMLISMLVAILLLEQVERTPLLSLGLEPVRRWCM